MFIDCCVPIGSISSDFLFRPMFLHFLGTMSMFSPTICGFTIGTELLTTFFGSVLVTVLLAGGTMLVAAGGGTMVLGGGKVVLEAGGAVVFPGDASVVVAAVGTVVVAVGGPAFLLGPFLLAGPFFLGAGGA